MKHIATKIGILIALLSVSLTAFAYDFQVDGIYYYITDAQKQTVAVTYKDTNYNSYSGSVTIPSEVTFNSKTYLVTSIGDWAFCSCSDLTSVTISNSVTSIGDWAFDSCSGLTSVTIPNSVTSIGDWAFCSCSGLSSVTIPNSVTSIGSGAFRGCSGLTSVSIPNSVTSVGSSALGKCSNLTSVTIPNSITSIEAAMFYDCSGLISVEIPNSVTSIGIRSFEGCSGLISVEIPNSVTSIGDGAFCSCSGLTSVTIPNSVTSIGSDAFSGCSGLNSVTIPESVTYIGRTAFSGCSALTALTFNASNCTMREDISDFVSFPASVLSISFGKNVIKVPKYLLFYCEKLMEVNSFIENPFVISKVFSSKSLLNGTLRVPKGTLSKYKAVGEWNQFANIVEADDSAIDDIERDRDDAELMDVFTLQGTSVLSKAGREQFDKLPAGIYLVKSDNNVKKVIK